ncbi:MAG: glycosyltransferase [Thermoanaerobaculia bacterium]
MRILAVDLGRQWRGGQGQTLHVSRELAARGHAVSVGASAGSELAARASAAGLEVVLLPEGAEVSPRLLVRFAREVRRFRPEVVWAGDAKAHGAAVWSGAARTVPLVVHRRVVFVPGRQPFAHLKYAVPERFLAVSEAAGSALLGYGVPAEKIRVVPDGLPAAAFVESPAAPAPPHRLVHAGAFDGRKGQAIVVDVLARLAGAGMDARATFLGDGRDRPRVEERARSLGILERCTFEGRVEDVAPRLAASHLLLLPSESEAAPLVLLEAMAAGCAVLAHDTGGVAELTRGGACGRLVPTLDAGAWADEARRLLADDGARAALVAAGRSAVAGRTTERTATLVEAELRKAARAS